jgi:hypothetical protein
MKDAAGQLGMRWQPLSRTARPSPVQEITFPRYHTHSLIAGASRRLPSREYPTRVFASGLGGCPNRAIILASGPMAGGTWTNRSHARPARRIDSGHSNYGCGSKCRAKVILCKKRSSCASADSASDRIASADGETDLQLLVARRSHHCHTRFHAQTTPIRAAD